MIVITIYIQRNDKKKKPSVKDPQGAHNSGIPPKAENTFINIFCIIKGPPHLWDFQNTCNLQVNKLPFFMEHLIRRSVV